MSPVFRSLHPSTLLHKLFASAPSRIAALALACTTGLLAGLGIFTWTYAEGGSYFSNDPRACANCHVMRDYLDSWQKSSHHARATCNDCHTPQAIVPKLIAKSENGMRHSWKFTFQNYPDRLTITRGNLQNLEQNCIACHGDLVGGLSVRGETGGGHGTGSCVHCHAGVGHGARY